MAEEEISDTELMLRCIALAQKSVVPKYEKRKAQEYFDLFKFRSTTKDGERG